MLESIGCEIPVDRVYLKVFEAQDATEGGAPS